MNWKSLISDLIASGMTQVQIAEKVSCAQSSISELLSEKTKQPNYAIGNALVALHKKSMRRKQVA